MARGNDAITITREAVPRRRRSAVNVLKLPASSTMSTVRPVAGVDPISNVEAKQIPPLLGDGKGHYRIHMLGNSGTCQSQSWLPGR